GPLAGREHLDHGRFALLVDFGEHLRRLQRARERAGGEDVEPGHERAQSLGGLFHFLLAVLRQGPQRVVARRPRLALLCDGMTDDHELHIEERDPRPALPATVVLVPGARLRYFVRTMHLSALLMALVLQASPSQVPDSAHVVIVATTDV